MKGDVHEDETVRMKDEGDVMFTSSGSAGRRIGVARGRLKSPEDFDRGNDKIRILFESVSDSQG